VPRLSYGLTRAFVAALRSIGIDAEIMPPSNSRTLELGSRHCTGDECLPLKIVIGDVLRLLEDAAHSPDRTAIFCPSADGPCRFGQYLPYLRCVLDSLGYSSVTLLSATTADSYSDFGPLAGEFRRTAWRGVVASDLLLKLLLRTRPYEIHRGSADALFHAALDDLCAALERRYPTPRAQLAALRSSLIRARDAFRLLPARYDPARPLIGIVGEIYCRLNTFSNDDLVRKLEEHGAEVWMSDVSEWIWYVHELFLYRQQLAGKRFAPETLAARLRARFQHRDEQALRAPFREDFRGYEEPDDARQILRFAEPFLPWGGADGEALINIGRCCYLARKGVDAILDISPFTCMNGVISEALYPAVSERNAGLPIRIFYFDATASQLDRDFGIFLELARAYRARKPYPRVYPACFPSAAEPAMAARSAAA
jgi:predicted nucleotide-binding protein (sugar kinase/HSP70/actin superfamily)